MNVAKIVLPLPLNSTFDYTFDNQKVEVGSIVEVNFSGRTMIGVVIAIDVKDILDIKYKIKNISRILDMKPIKQEQIDFLMQVSNYNLIPIGLVFKLMLPTIISDKTKTIKKYYV